MKLGQQDSCRLKLSPANEWEAVYDLAFDVLLTSFMVTKGHFSAVLRPSKDATCFDNSMASHGSLQSLVLRAGTLSPLAITTEVLLQPASFMVSSHGLMVSLDPPEQLAAVAKLRC